VAAIIGLRRPVAFEGQAAMELEMILDDTESGSYDFSWEEECKGPIGSPRFPLYVVWSGCEAGFLRRPSVPGFTTP
jgi:hydrogenase maturation factor HypF (carbamoyltransferase family)